MTIAAAYFDAAIAFSKAMEPIHQAAESAWPGHEEWTADYYDGSIELYGPNDGLAIDLSPIWDAGFKLAWVHRHARYPANRDRCTCPAIGAPT